ncbi:LptA, protein essential for LPS transport across the periplasm [Bathymodiolus heckerae thiotrophic gill symbiont]|nr:LptA, protein essential for LPS transport across the periplasm [Bathymodiolus heckerae thiotrophic gill symbiont]SMN15429.1 LptA, protein essential for LPS transport across the periplasm [uncultured Candidatus Thioglobus sp.]
MLSFTAQALNQEPVNVKAYAVVIDEPKGLSVWTGDARVVQGSLTLSAEKIQIFNIKHTITKVIAKGSKNKPAYYKHNQPKQPHFVEATALKITYFADKQLVRLQGDAHLTQGFDYFSGSILNYDIKNDKIIASKSKDSVQRVKFKIKL